MSWLFFEMFYLFYLLRKVGRFLTWPLSVLSLTTRFWFLRITFGARFFLVVQSKFARCLSRDEGLENPRPHFSHVYGFWPVCIFMWNFSSYDCAKAFPQYEHTHGFSLVCVRRTWLSCAACEAKARPQCRHLNGFSPLCWRICVRRIEEAVKDLTQCGHL